MKNLTLAKAIALALCLFAFDQSTSAQQAQNLLVGDVVMPPPSVASLGKYTDVSVGYSTGSVNITIPIHTLRTGSLSLPISLNYHTSGVRAAEMADWVGTGWALAAGGMVTRTVQGVADEDDFGFWNTGWQMYQCNSSYIPRGTGLERTVAAGITNQTIDGEPDLFSFNLPGYSGKFYFDYVSNVRVPVLISESDVKIEEIVEQFRPRLERIRGFKITIPDGTMYWFGEKDGQTAHDISNANGSLFTFVGWYLLKIESADQKHNILLEYQDDYYGYESPGSRSKVYYYDLGTTSPGPSPGIQNFSPPVSGSPIFSNIYNGKKLSKIRTSNELIDFVATEDRKDTHPIAGRRGKKLDKIEIKTASYPNAGYCKSFNFIYDYFQSSPSASSPNDNRLRLLKVQESSCDNTETLPPYLIEYNGDFMPNILTKAIDHWGYYNGATQNEASNDLNIPPTTIQIPPNSTTALTQISRGASDRETNENEMVKGSIKKITYPTGGHTEYFFEANEYCLNAATANEKPTFTETSLVQRLPCQANAVTTGKLFFVAPHDSLVLCRLAVRRCESDPPYPAKYLVPPPVVLLLMDLDGKEIDRFEFDGTLDPVNLPLPILKLFPKLALGNWYWLKIPSKEDICTDYSPYIDLSLLEQPEQNALNNGNPISVKVGGLRIKKIIQHDGGNGTPDVVRSYEYNNGAGCSSGTLLGKPRYSYYEGFPSVSSFLFSSCGPILPNCVPIWVFKAKFFDNSIVPLSTFEGYHIVYSRVLELLDEPATAANEYTFQPADPVVYDPNIYPFLSPQQLIAGGQLQKAWRTSTDPVVGGEEVTGASVNAHYSNHYFYRAEWDVIVYVEPFFGCVYFDIPITTGNHFSIRGYPIRSGNYKVTQRKINVDGLETIHNTEYGSLEHHFPTATSFENSDGKVYRTEYVYSNDYPDATIKTDLLNRNIKSKPWKTIQTTNGAEVDATELEYAFFNLSNGNPQAQPSGAFPRVNKVFRYEYTWDGAGQLVSSGKQFQASVDRYTPNGFPFLYTGDGWLPETYDWTSDGLLQKRTYEKLNWEYHYYPGTRLLERIIDKDGQTTSFEYDALGRLKKSKARDNNVITDYIYHFKEATNPHNFINTSVAYTPIAGSQLTSVAAFQYMDGLGRPLQTVKVQASPDQKDVVDAVTYDSRGRIARQYIPFKANQTTGAFVPSIPGGLAHTATVYENHAFSRPLSVKPPAWYATEMQYGSNETPIAHPNGTNYPIGTLVTVVTIDPNGNKNIAYKDKKGQVILERRSNNSGTETADTYTGYDDKGRPVVTYPPDADINTPDLIFQYVYDGADNIIYKKVPSKGGESMVYDARNLQIFYQDVPMGQRGHWLMNQYDEYGRSIKTGFSFDQNTIDELLTETTYDLVGRITQSRAKVLDNTNTWIVKNYGYDNYSRLTSTGGNSLIGAEFTSIDNYDFADNILQTTRQHTSPYRSLNIVERAEFDHQGRKTAAFHKINNNSEVTLARLFYDHRNLMIRKELGSDAVGLPWQNIDYAYNAQSWLTAINAFCSNSSPAGATAPEAIGMSMSIMLDTSAWNNNSNNGKATVKVNFSGETRTKEGVATPFTFQPTYEFRNLGTDSTHFVFVEAPSVNGPTLLTIPIVLAQTSVQAEGLADFYLGLEQSILKALAQHGLKGELNRLANIGQEAVEKALLPLSAYAAANAPVGAVAAASSTPPPPRPDVFALAINYDAAFPLLNAPQNKNGNITSISWQVGCGPIQYYGFAYDFLDRMKKATFAEYDSYTGSFRNFNRFNEEVSTADNPAGYDKRGNIQRLKRRGFLYYFTWGDIDDLSYAYAGNRLSSVSEASNTGRGFKGAGSQYQYDENGNMTSDAEKRANCEYNHLNLPKRIDFIPSDSPNWIEWLYDANGNKLRKTTMWQTHQTVTDYCEGIEYRNGQLESVFHAEGRVMPLANNAFRYQYALKDHLGNTRLLFSDQNNNNSIDLSDMLEHHYYPFGLVMEGNQTLLGSFNGYGYGPFLSSYRYLYNGKELNTDFGDLTFPGYALHWYDFGARWYDPAMARWWNVDPMAEMYEGDTPYNYGLNNPILFADPSGMSAQRDIYLDKNDNVVATIEDGTKTNHYFRVEKIDKGYYHVTAELGTDYTSRTLVPQGNWMTLASINTQNNPSRTEPARHMYNFASAAPEFWANIVETLFAFEAGVEKGIERTVLSLAKKKTTKPSQKEKSTIIPTWAEGQRRLPGESGKDFAKRLMDARYGPGKYNTGPGSEYSQLQKYNRTEY